jgi:hypothetical protein
MKPTFMICTSKKLTGEGTWRRLCVTRVTRSQRHGPGYLLQHHGAFQYRLIQVQAEAWCSNCFSRVVRRALQEIQEDLGAEAVCVREVILAIPQGFKFIWKIFTLRCARAEHGG